MEDADIGIVPAKRLLRQQPKPVLQQVPVRSPAAQVIQIAGGQPVHLRPVDPSQQIAPVRGKSDVMSARRERVRAAARPRLPQR